VEVRAAILTYRSTNRHQQIQPVTYCLTYISLPKTPSHYTFTVNMATASFAESFVNS
jgi:hypothetical protein